MGFVGRKKFPFPGDVIDFIKTPSLIMSSQCGSPWPTEETCSHCWFMGERRLIPSKKKNVKGDFKLLHPMGEQPVLFFNNHDQEPPDVKMGHICLSGIKNLDAALVAPILENCQTGRCSQRASSNPFTEVDDG